MQIDHRTVITGRVQTYLEHPEKQTLPPSCRVAVYHNNLAEFLSETSQALCYGAGVKVILDEFHATQPRKKINWGFYLDPSHPDFSHMTEEQWEFYRVPSDVSELMKWSTYVITVADSMRKTDVEGVPIEDSWGLFIELAIAGKDIIVDLSNLRPSGVVNEIGLTSTGALGSHDESLPVDEIGKDSFLSIYQYIADHLERGDLISFVRLLGQLCKVDKRGGAYKNGIITHSLPWNHPDFDSYVSLSLSELPGGSKKGIDLTREIIHHPEKMKAVADDVNEYSSFLYKKFMFPPDLHPNVCMGIMIKDRGACLVGHANLGRCQISEIPEAYCNAVRLHAEIYKKWRDQNPDKSSIYRPLDDDRQIAVGWLGLANLLAMNHVTYETFTKAIECVAYKRPYMISETNSETSWETAKAWVIAKGIEKAYIDAAAIAREYGLERFATIEPNQRCWIDERNRDLRGGYACRNIDPPFARRERRYSETDKSGNRWYDHGAGVETLSDVDHSLRQRLWEAFMVLANESTGGMNHASSFDLTKKIDETWLFDFIEFSPLATTYYQQASKVDQSFLSKGLVLEVESVGATCNPLEPDLCTSCGE